MIVLRFPTKLLSLVLLTVSFIHIHLTQQQTEGKGDAKPTKTQPSSNSKRDRSDSQVEQAKLLAAISSGPAGSNGAEVKTEGKNGKGKKATAVVTESTATNEIAAAKTNAPVQSIGKRQVSDVSDVTTLDTQTSLPFKKRRKPDSGSNSSSASVNGSASGTATNAAAEYALLAERELALAVGRIAAGASINPLPTSTHKDTDSERDSTCSSRTSNVIETAGEGCSAEVGGDGFNVVNKV